jgi:hypothetical protein
VQRTVRQLKQDLEAGRIRQQGDGAEMDGTKEA